MDHVSVDGGVGWKDVYFAKPEFSKHIDGFDEYYKISMLSAPTAEHRRLRRLYAPAFTDKAIRVQEPILQRFVSLLLQRLSEQEGQAVDINTWFNYTSFDIMGELTFGESFHCLDRSELHAWIALIFENLKAVVLLRAFRSYALPRKLLPFLMTKEQVAKKEGHENYTRDKVLQRISEGRDARQDFMMHFMEHMEKGELTENEVRVNAGVFIVAGSETTAVTLSTLIYYICKNSEIYAELTREIRETFNTEDDITVSSTIKLEYFNMCLKEALRIHAPAPDLASRTSPGAFVGGHWLPEGVSTSHLITPPSNYQPDTNQTEITLPTHSTFQNPTHFHHPSTFAPARFAPSSTSQYYDPAFAHDSLSVFEPFGAGARDCIGKHLAWAQMRLIAARLLWRYDVQVDWEVSDGWLERQRVWMVWEKGERVGDLKASVRERKWGGGDEKEMEKMKEEDVKAEVDGVSAEELIEGEDG